MKYLKKQSVLIILSLFLALNVLSLSAVTVKLSSREISANDTIVITIENEGESIKEILLRGDAFQTISQATSSSLTFNNGSPKKISSSIYTLVPLKTGKQELSVLVDGKQFGPFTVNIKNSGGQTQQQNPQETFKVNFERTSSQPLYINEPEVVDLFLASKKRIIAKRFVKKPSHAGLSLTVLRTKNKTLNTPKTAASTQLAGRWVPSEKILTYSVYPYIAGRHNISSVVLALTINERSSTSLFSRNYVLPIKVAPFTIEAIDFPKNGRPKNFKNNYGRFDISLESKENIAVGEPLEVTVKATGIGNFEALTMPQLEKLLKPTTSSPFTITKGDVLNNFKLRQKKYVGYKQQTYYIVFNNSGTYNFPPISISSFNRELGYTESEASFPEIEVIEKKIETIIASKKTQQKLPNEPIDNFLQQQFRFKEISLQQLLQYQVTAGMAFTGFLALLMFFIGQYKKHHAVKPTPLIALIKTLQTLPHASSTGNVATANISALQDFPLYQLKSALEKYISEEYKNFFAIKINKKPLVFPTLRKLRISLEKKLKNLSTEIPTSLTVSEHDKGLKLAKNTSTTKETNKTARSTKKTATPTTEEIKIHALKQKNRITVDLAILSAINSYEDLFFAERGGSKKDETTFTPEIESKAKLNHNSKNDKSIIDYNCVSPISTLPTQATSTAYVHREIEKISTLLDKLP